jgi:hypothetical protein
MKRFLRRNHSCACPTRIVVVDTETLPEPARDRPNVVYHRFRLGVAARFRFEGERATRRRELHFTDLGAFWDWLSELLAPGKPVYLFAHNLPFDLTALRFWERLESGEYSCKAPATARDDGAPGAKIGGEKWGLLATEDPPTIVECWHANGGRLVCLDTLNWHKASLEALAAGVGLVKVPLPAFSADDAAWFKRCVSDAQILERVVLDLLRRVKRLDLGVFRYTVNAQAMAHYRHRHLPETTPISVSDDLEAKAHERQALVFARQWLHWGGRIVRRLDELPPRPALGPPPPTRLGPIHVLDVNSCYASVMRKNLFPRELLKIDDSGDFERFRARLVRPSASAAVLVDSPYEAYPLKKNGRLWWAVGRFWTHLCGPELLRAVKDGDVVAVGRVQWYSLADLFTTYVDEWWGRRQRAAAGGDEAEERFAKAMLLALHGKWGQQAHTWEYVAGKPAPQPWGVWHESNPNGGEPITYRSVGWATQRRTKGGETAHGFPAITAWINSYAREKIRDWCRRVGDDELIWEDCDQLAVTDDGLRRLQAAPAAVGPGLGQLRWLWSAQWGDLYGVRDYQLGNVKQVQGLARSARRLADGSWEQEDWARLNGQLMAAPPAGPTVETVRKLAPQPSRLGLRRPDGSFVHYRAEALPNEP